LESKKDKFGAYLSVAESVISLLDMCERSDKRFYFLMHEEASEDGFKTPRTAGKLLKEKFVFEGFFTVVLRCAQQDGAHVFETKNQGASVVKTPEGMFQTETIENDLSLVDAATDWGCHHERPNQMDARGYTRAPRLLFYRRFLRIGGE
jgi:hypothetical protein